MPLQTPIPRQILVEIIVTFEKPLEATRILIVPSVSVYVYVPWICVVRRPRASEKALRLDNRLPIVDTSFTIFTNNIAYKCLGRAFPAIFTNHIYPWRTIHEHKKSTVDHYVVPGHVGYHLRSHVPSGALCLLGIQ